MFKRSLNRAVVRLKLKTVTPLLIKAGDTGLDPAQADLSCVRTRHGRFGETVYVPGSSLKGVIRSAAEAMVRTENPDEPAYGGVRGTCDPLDHRRSCGSRFGKRDAPSPSHEVHAGHCLACRTFGSTAMKGRVSIRDLFPWPGEAERLDDDLAENAARANAVEGRHGVAIDRIMGSVKHGPFDMEVVPAGVSFWGDIALENYQAWQLGLVAAALDELDGGFAQLGSSKSRGLGVVQVNVERVVHEQPLRAGEAPLGVGEMVDEGTRRAYRLLADRPLPRAEGRPRGLSRRFEVDGAAAKAWLEEALGALEVLQ